MSDVTAALPAPRRGEVLSSSTKGPEPGSVPALPPPSATTRKLWSVLTSWPAPSRARTRTRYVPGGLATNASAVTKSKAIGPSRGEVSETTE